MLFISDIQNYVSIKLWKTAGSIHLFKIKRHTEVQRYKIKYELLVGYTRERLECSQSDFQ